MSFTACQDDGSRRVQFQRGLVAVLVAALVVQGLSCGTVADAQDKGRDIGNALLRALIESQIERDERRSGRPRPGQPVPPQAPATAEMQRLRPLVASFAQESANFSNLVTADSRRNRELRQSAIDAVRIQAGAAALQQRAAVERDHRQLFEGFRELSADWQTLSHTVSHAGGVSPQTKQSLERLDALDSQYCQLLGIHDQIDTRELGRVMGALEADLRTLTDEIQYAAGLGPNRAQVVGQLRRLQEQTHHLAHDLTDGTPLRTLTTEYQASHQAWAQLGPRLAPFQDQSILRAIGRINDGHRTMHRLLRLAFPVDAAQLVRLAAEIRNELTTLARTITLDQLRALPDTRSIISSTDAVFGCAENLAEVVSNPQKIGAAGEAWFYLEEAWNVLAFHIEPIHNPETRQHARHVEQLIDTLRSSIGVTVAFDQRIAAQRAASLHTLADRFHVTVHQWLSRPGKQDRTIETEVEALEKRCSELESLTQARNSRAVLRAKCDQVLEEWQHLRPLLARCDTQERETLERLTESFIPELVKTRMMLED